MSTWTCPRCGFETDDRNEWVNHSIMYCVLTLRARVDALEGKTHNVAVDARYPLDYTKLVLPCPFCGEVHLPIQVGKVVGYNKITGEAIGGEYKDAIDLGEKHAKGSAYIPLEVWQHRPIEDALRTREWELMQEITKLKAEVQSLSDYFNWVLDAERQPTESGDYTVLVNNGTLLTYSIFDVGIGWARNDVSHWRKEYPEIDDECIEEEDDEIDPE